MADIEETEHGPTGLMREWLARASRAPRDPAWVADGMISDRWLPASPVTGHIDAFRWETPVERLAGAVEEAPPQIWPDPSIKPEPPEIAVTSKPFWSTSGSAAAIGSAGAAASTATVEIAAEVESAATVAQNAHGPAAIVIESEPALPEKTGAEPAEQPQAAQSVEAPAPVAAPPAPAIIEAAAPKEPAEREAAPPAPSPNAAPSDEKPPVAETETAVAVAPKPGLPEHIVTAPDDPGPESLTPLPAPPRKRGLFG
jgi:HemY protein